MSLNISAWKELANIDAGNKKWEKQQEEMLEKLIVAVLNAEYENVFYLIKTGSPINRALEDRMTPLSAAILNEDFEMVKTLIKKGADPNLHFDEGLDAFSLATTLNNNKICNYLIENGTQIKNYRMIGTFETRLITATKASNSGVVEYVLAKDKKSVNLYDHYGKTALHYNLQKSPYTPNDLKIAELLIGANADKNAIDADGFTPLDYISDSQELQNVLDKATLLRISNKGLEALKTKEQKEKLKEKEFIEKDYKEVFQPKMPSPKTIGKYRKYNTI